MLQRMCGAIYEQGTHEPGEVGRGRANEHAGIERVTRYADAIAEDRAARETARPGPHTTPTRCPWYLVCVMTGAFLVHGGS
jgi:hypothetical protein